MTVFHADLAARAVPRYTSYPTAAEFSDAVGALDQSKAIASVAPGAPVSLYLHIPYCHEICWYCGCNTGAIGRVERLAHYVEALIAEIALVGPLCGGTVSSVHFGGGSPNALTRQQLRCIAEAIRARFDIAPDAEWAGELDPRHIDREAAAAFAEIGVARVSLGAQTFDLAVQAKVNRLQPYRMVRNSVELLRDAGIDRINLDLMYGLPGQTLDSIASTIVQARNLAPDRVAMFGYAHLPAMLPRQRMIDPNALPDAEARFWQSMLTRDLLIEAGFAEIGFDHFANPEDSLARAARAGTLRRNFQGFTDDRADVLIGLGASAISQFAGLIVQNEKHVGRYRMLAGNGRFAGVRGVVRNREDALRGAVIERILCDGLADVAAIEREHGHSPSLMVAAAPALEDLAKRGLVECTGTALRVTEDGRPYARLVAAAFDAYRPISAGQFSRAV